MVVASGRGVAGHAGTTLFGKAATESWHRPQSEKNPLWKGGGQAVRDPILPPNPTHKSAVLNCLLRPLGLFLDGVGFTGVSNTSSSAEISSPPQRLTGRHNRTPQRGTRTRWPRVRTRRRVHLPRARAPQVHLLMSETSSTWYASVASETPL